MNTLPPESSDRLVTLCDGRPGLRSTMHIEISEPADPLSPSHGERDGERGRDYTGNGTDSSLPSDGRGVRGEGSPAPDSQPVLDFISSDETLDRYDEIIQASGWKLSSYARNPVFQNAHQYGDIIFTLGRALITEIRSSTPHSALRTPHLYQRIQFATDAN